MAVGSPFGMLSGRIATWIQVVCTSSASLPPFETPWSKTAGFGGVAPANGQAPLPAALSGGGAPARPLPPPPPRGGGCFLGGGGRGGGRGFCVSWCGRRFFFGIAALVELLFA